jgi:hypothetical protein
VYATTIDRARNHCVDRRRHDPWFQAELNRRRSEVVEAAVERVRALLPKALEALESELERGKNHVAAAIQIAKLARLGESSLSIDTANAEEIVNRLVEAKLNAVDADRRKYQSQDDRILDSLIPPNRAKCEADEWAARNAVLHEIESQLA